MPSPGRHELSRSGSASRPTSTRSGSGRAPSAAPEPLGGPPGADTSSDRTSPVLVWLPRVGDAVGVSTPGRAAERAVWWPRAYRRSWLRYDLVAGLTVAAVVI